MNSKRESILMYGAGMAAFIFIWQLLALYFNSAIILPTPLATFNKLLAIIPTQKFLQSLGASFIRVLLALAISVPAGLVFGLAAALNRKADYFTRPLFNFISATPVMAVILIVFLWVGTQLTPPFTAFLMVFPVMAANTAQAVRTVNPQLLELFAAFNMNGAEKLKYLYIPEIVPYLKAALRSCLSLSWKVVVAAEVLVQPVLSMGSGMQRAKANLETAELFAWTIATVAAAGLSELLLNLFYKKGKI
jgi:NitT/TauT family transport system permease protein